MDTERLRAIQFNASMAEYDDASLEQRSQSLIKAIEEIKKAYQEQVLGQQQEVADVVAAQLPALDDAAGYATKLLYESSGQIFHPDDIKRAIERTEGYKREDDASWSPTSDNDVQLVVDLVGVGAKLSFSDPVPAYGPHIQGRPFEITDPAESMYNKFGRLLDAHDQYLRIQQN